MLSPETEQKIRQHLRLARGFLGTTQLGLGNLEFEERNALSRGYYALLHACIGWQLMKFGFVIEYPHSKLHAEMDRRRGKEFGNFMRDVHGLRIAADYREGWSPARLVSEDKLNKTRIEVLRLCQETEDLLEIERKP